MICHAQRQYDAEYGYNPNDIGWYFLENIDTQLLTPGVIKKEIEIRHAPDAKACCGKNNRPTEMNKFFFRVEEIDNQEVNSKILDQMCVDVM